MSEILRPRLVVIAGPNGSGKTFATENLIGHTWGGGCEYVNPDFIARDEFGGWNSREAFLKAAEKAKGLRERCLADRRDLMFETVFSTPGKVEFVKRAQVSGFFVRLFFICTDSPSINAARIVERYLQGGHVVPIDKIVDRYGKSIANCAVAATFVDRAYVYDNSVNGEAPRLLFKTIEGRVSKVYEEGPINEWACNIFNVLERAQGVREDHCPPRP